MRVTITYCRYYMQRELRREKRFRYRGVTVTADAVMIPLDHVLVSRSNGYGLRTNCSGHDSSKRRIATTHNFCSTIAVSAVTITVSVVTIQVYFSPCVWAHRKLMRRSSIANWRCLNLRWSLLQAAMMLANRVSEKLIFLICFSRFIYVYHVQI